MYLHPARSRGYILSVILCPPSLHEGHTDGAHLGQFVDCLEPVVDSLLQHLVELVSVEDHEIISRRNLADCGGIESVVIVGDS